MTNPELRHKVIQLYKTLLYMGKEYPKGYQYFRSRCHNAFMKNKDVQDEEKIKQLINHGQFVVKELEALYFLKKYRTLKHRYYEEDKDGDNILQKLESSVNKHENLSKPENNNNKT